MQRRSSGEGDHHGTNDDQGHFRECHSYLVFDSLSGFPSFTQNGCVEKSEPKDLPEPGVDRGGSLFQVAPPAYRCAPKQITSVLRSIGLSSLERCVGATLINHASKRLARSLTPSMKRSIGTTQMP